MPEDEETSGLRKLDDHAFLERRSEVRQLLESAPGTSAEASALAREYAALTAEFDRRARALWSRATRETGNNRERLKDGP
jgi:hypothetical protein